MNAPEVSIHLWPQVAGLVALPVAELKPDFPVLESIEAAAERVRRLGYRSSTTEEPRRQTRACLTFRFVFKILKKQVA